MINCPSNYLACHLRAGSVFSYGAAQMGIRTTHALLCSQLYISTLLQPRHVSSFLAIVQPTDLVFGV
jgi:hypothetical protein